MSELNRTYDPSREEGIYTRWLEKGYFKAKPNPDKKPYTIMIPPPNITDKLHVGHALNNTIQDILIRAKRMQGYEALWLPGTDHAAISTEVQVIKALAKEGITKDDLGREAFLERVWEWQKEYGGTIVNQLKKLGSSCDWERERFTMDEGLSDAVLEAFVRLYSEGKIYRGERLINWCIKCQTTISDAEVEHEDGEGQLYHFKYPITDSDGFIAFATTRPETMLGDTAIAVHPEDERYTNLIGKYVTVPMVNRQIPIVADSYVDPEYGTGAVKVTPAHDPNDFEIGQRHNLPIINVMNDDGTINETGAHYNGLTREAARKKIVEEMTTLGLYIKTETITHAKGTHDRCSVIVEPLIKLQWFLKMDELSKPALEAYTSGKLNFHKGRHGKVYQHWLEIIRDWCISRQIWWGHRIPAYYCPQGHITVGKTAPTACATCGDTTLRQDEDTLDTWFSSALWPFSTLGWPSKTPDLDYFYPTNVLVTGQDIIFFWVVRMMFMGYKFTGSAPFTDVFINGLVRDENGIKMSKTLGNGIDPLDVVNKFGADVLRLTFASNSPENDSRFHWERVEFCRNFMNKLWNATRFVLMNIESPIQTPSAEASPTLETEDRWILSRVNELTKEVTAKIDSYDLGMAAQKIIDFIWDEFCDWYVEIVKPRLYGQKATDGSMGGTDSEWAAKSTLCTVLMQALKLLHPIAPFITEDLFLAIQENGMTPPEGKQETIMLAPWPEYKEALTDLAAEKDIEAVKEAVRAIRNIRAEKQVPPSQKINVIIQPASSDAEILFKRSTHFIAALAGALSVTVENDPNGAQTKRDKTRDVVFAAISNAEVYVPLEVDIEKEKARLTKEQQKLVQELARVDGKLSNQGFMAKAPESLVAEEREKREKFAAMLAKIEAELGAL
ncbi:MAG: valine--tRNA ligase [Defluviitaleaceae bacterium]|nr:valine--tRNA ligase [Defluviitaleaceae bacterium]